MTIDHAKEVLNAEIDAIAGVRDRLDERFATALDLMAECSGRIVACGMGKAGLIAKKISATLASTGTPSFFLHPADALHGDMGMVRAGDVALILSNSGESEEVVKLLPLLRALVTKIVAITATDRSTLAGHADAVLTLGEIEEACPLGLAPTATTTAMLALGDALALCLMRRRGFQVHDYARLHPAGSLGKKVLPVEAVMRVGDSVARVGPETEVHDVVYAITRARAGAAAVVDSDGLLLGIFTDGDLRRGIETNPEFLHTPVADSMIAGCLRATAGMLAQEALTLMTEKRIADLPVVDADGRLLGMADMKGLVATL